MKYKLYYVPALTILFKVPFYRAFSYATLTIKDDSIPPRVGDVVMIPPHLHIPIEIIKVEKINEE